MSGRGPQSAKPLPLLRLRARVRPSVGSSPGEGAKANTPREYLRFLQLLDVRCIHAAHLHGVKSKNNPPPQHHSIGQVKLPKRLLLPGDPTSSLSIVSYSASSSSTAAAVASFPASFWLRVRGRE